MASTVINSMTVYEKEISLSEDVRNGSTGISLENYLCYKIEKSFLSRRHVRRIPLQPRTPIAVCRGHGVRQWVARFILGGHKSSPKYADGLDV